MITLLIVALVLGSFVYVAWPVLNASSGNLKIGYQRNGHMKGLLDQRDNHLATIKDLEFDYRMGKLSDADFADLDTHYRLQAIEILERIDLARSSAKDQKEIKASNRKNTMNLKNVSAPFCPICGETVIESDEFCGNCGSALR